MNDVQKYQGLFRPSMPVMMRQGRLAPNGSHTDAPFGRKGRKRRLCLRLVGRVHLPKRRRAEDGSGKRNGRGTGAPYGDRSCSLQQYP